MIFGEQECYNFYDFPYGKFIKELKKKPSNIKKGEKLMDYVCSFDTETTSTILDGKKIGFMYLWGFSFDNKYYCIGRTIDEFMHFIDNMIEFLSMFNLHIAVYCHNLTFDYTFIFDFLNERYRDNQTFTIDKNDVVTYDIPFIQFRCSRKLTNLKLDQACKKFNVEIGKLNQDKYDLDLDYYKIRTPETKLTKREELYFIHDLQAVVCLIKKILSVYDDTIKSIPLTATGFVRRRCRRSCLDDDKFVYNYRAVFDLTPEVYNMLKDNRKGGDSHGSRFAYGKIFYKVHGVDAISQYLLPMLNDYMPMSKFIEHKDFTNEQFVEYLDKYCCLFDCHFDRVEIKQMDDWDCLSKSWILTNPKEAKYISEDNGRILIAENIDLTLNEIDLKLILKHYNCKGMRVRNLYTAFRARLPYQLRNVIFEYFKEKTDLDKYIDTELECLRDNKKSEANAIYGMMLTDIIHEKWNIGKDSKGKRWMKEDNSNADMYYTLHDYFKTQKRCHFTFFAWGNWIVSHSRAYLEKAYEMKCIKRQLYHDTDSLKGIGLNMDAINKYNAEIMQKNASNGYIYKGICPGLLKVDSYYDKFVHYGSKCYITQTDNKTNITIAGCYKGCADQIEDIEKITLPYTFKNATMTAIHNYDDIHTIEVDGCKIKTASNIYLEQSDFTIFHANDFYNRTKNFKPTKPF